MKIDYINNEKFICYISNYYYTFNKNSINDLLVKIIKILKKKYNIDAYGNYEVICHIDPNYGIILEINKDIDEFSKYTRKANLNIAFCDEEFIYEISDYLLFKNKYKIKNIKDRYYIKSRDCNYLNICEYCNKIIYGKELNFII